MLETKDIIDFNEHAKRCFDNWKSTTLLKATKNTLKGEVELKDGTIHILTVKKHSKTFVTYDHTMKKGN